MAESKSRLMRWLEERMASADELEGRMQEAYPPLTAMIGSGTMTNPGGFGSSGSSVPMDIQSRVNAELARLGGGSPESINQSVARDSVLSGRGAPQRAPLSPGGDFAGPQSSGYMAEKIAASEKMAEAARARALLARRASAAKQWGVRGGGLATIAQIMLTPSELGDSGETRLREWKAQQAAQNPVMAGEAAGPSVEIGEPIMPPGYGDAPIMPPSISFGEPILGKTPEDMQQLMDKYRNRKR